MAGREAGPDFGVSITGLLEPRAPEVEQTGLPALREVSFQPASRNARVAGKMALILFGFLVCVGLGFYGKARYQEHRYQQAAKLHLQAFEAFEAEKFEEAETGWQEALLLFRDSGDTEGQVQSYGWLAKTQAAQEHFPQALAFLKQARELPGSEPDAHLEELYSDYSLAHGTRTLEEAQTRMEAELWDEAYEGGVNALAFLSEGEADDQTMADVHKLLGYSQLELGGTLTAIEHLQDSLGYEKDPQVVKVLAALNPEPKPVARTARPSKPERVVSQPRPSTRRSRRSYNRYRREDRVRASARVEADYPTVRRMEEEDRFGRVKRTYYRRDDGRATSKSSTRRSNRRSSVTRRSRSSIESGPRSRSPKILRPNVPKVNLPGGSAPRAGSNSTRMREIPAYQKRNTTRRRRTTSRIPSTYTPHSGF